MQVRYFTRKNGDRHTSVYDPVTNTGSQFNGHIPGGIIPHRMAAVRKQMHDSSPHMRPLLLEGPKPTPPTLRLV